MLDTASFALAATRIALAIMLDALALVVWDIGTRSPLRLVRDVRRGLQHRDRIASGAVRFGIGAAALYAGALVSAPLAGRGVDFTLVECWVIGSALIVELLIGTDLRARSR